MISTYSSSVRYSRRSVSNTSRATKINHDQGKFKRSFVICDEMLLKILTNMCNDFLLAHSRKQPSVNFMTPRIHKLRIIDRLAVLQGSVYYQPIQCIVTREFSKLFQQFSIVCGSHLMTPVVKQPRSSKIRILHLYVETFWPPDPVVTSTSTHGHAIALQELWPRRLAFIIKSGLMSVQLIMQMMIVQNFFIGANTYLGGSSGVAERLVWKIN